LKARGTWLRGVIVVEALSFFKSLASLCHVIPLITFSRDEKKQTRSYAMTGLVCAHLRSAMFIS